MTQLHFTILQSKPLILPFFRGSAGGSGKAEQPDASAWRLILSAAGRSPQVFDGNQKSAARLSPVILSKMAPDPTEKSDRNILPASHDFSYKASGRLGTTKPNNRTLARGG